MLYEFSRVTTPMYRKRYIELLLDAYEELNMAYPFTVSLAYLASPVLMREEIFLAFDDDHQVVGCLSFIRGTAQYDYSNREVIQLQVLYIEETHRCSTVLLSFLQMLIQYVDYQEEPVQELQFWSKTDKAIRELVFKRTGITPNTTDSEADIKLDFYKLPFTIVQSYITQFSQQQYL